MTNYPYKHDAGRSSLVYKVEKYRFRYRGVSAAEIEIADAGEEQTFFSFKIEQDEINWPDLPSNFLKEFHPGSDELIEFGFEPRFFKTKEEALQAAIDAIEHILRKYKAPDKLEFPSSKN
ncbi:hypothetical protein ABES38_08690 [Bacillus gobiensis]|uniref:hypothetical protein n=1 Tax=Bacillus gobiensis TaxID=1441095 RepID=UPI003D234D3A